VALLAATEADLEPIAERVAAGRLTDAAEIGLAVVPEKVVHPGLLGG
jgi:hypothetical protein